MPVLSFKTKPFRGILLMRSLSSLFRDSVQLIINYCSVHFVLMFRVPKSPSDLKAFNTGWNIGWFLFTSVYLPETLAFYGNWRRSNDKQRIKAQPFSTLSESAKYTSGKDKSDVSQVKRKKSALYTKTGDKGMSSVS